MWSRWLGLTSVLQCHPEKKEGTHKIVSGKDD
jgi:putative component of membrane protein insertase Oxa1/YidC/SpoIIIJ protein YidD